MTDLFATIDALDRAAHTLDVSDEDAAIINALLEALKEGKVIRGAKDKRGNKPIALLVIPWVERESK